ncbi:MAG: sulfotransferase domain-containing protein [Cyanobacteria bacterium P01_H01_bin.119]
MLIFCCGLMRSGSTVQYKITESLVQKLGKGKGYGWLPHIENREELFSLATEKDADNYYIVKIHGYSPHFGDLIAQNQAKAIYVYRDLRDVVASFMSWRATDFNGVIRERWIEKVLKDSQNWESLPDIHISQYETLIGDLRGEVSRIADYIGLDVSEDIIEQVADECSIQKTKQKMQAMEKTGLNLDTKSILHKNHIKSGKAKSYLGELTPAQIAFVEAKSALWMNAHTYDLDYRNPVYRQLQSLKAIVDQIISDFIFYARRSKSKIDRRLRSSP